MPFYGCTIAASTCARAEAERADIGPDCPGPICWVFSGLLVFHQSEHQLTHQQVKKEFVALSQKGYRTSAKVTFASVRFGPPVH